MNEEEYVKWYKEYNSLKNKLLRYRRDFCGYCADVWEDLKDMAEPLILIILNIVIFIPVLIIQLVRLPFRNTKAFEKRIRSYYKEISQKEKGNGR